MKTLTKEMDSSTAILEKNVFRHGRAGRLIHTASENYWRMGFPRHGIKP